MILSLLLASCLPSPAIAQEPAPVVQYDCAAIMLPYEARMMPTRDHSGSVPLSGRLPAGWVPVGGAWSPGQNYPYVIACRAKA